LARKLVTTASRIAVTVTLLALVAIGCPTFLGLAVSQERTMDRELFFEGLMGGGAETGMVYVGIPLKKELLVAAKTSKERGAVWESFFRRVLREEPQFDQPGRAPYWGDYVYQKVDWASVEAAVNVRVGDVLRVRTPTAEGAVR
jgi:hypothetical protein